MDRFYKDVAVGPAVEGGYSVLLDGRPVRTPGKNLLRAPTQALADAVAAEWAAQDKTVVAASMPLTQILTTAADRIVYRAEITQQLLQYLDGDLLCYRTAEPKPLADEQERLWGPWLLWFTQRFGQTLDTTTTLVRLDQPRPAHDAAKAYIEALDDHAFTAFHLASSVTGSLVLALALIDGALSADDAWACALCEELFYEKTHDLEKYGLDPIEEKRRNAMHADLNAVKTYLTLARS